MSICVRPFFLIASIQIFDTSLSNIPKHFDVLTGKQSELV